MSQNTKQTKNVLIKIGPLIPPALSYVGANSLANCEEVEEMEGENVYDKTKRGIKGERQK